MTHKYLPSFAISYSGVLVAMWCAIASLFPRAKQTLPPYPLSMALTNFEMHLYGCQYILHFRKVIFAVTIFATTPFARLYAFWLDRYFINCCYLPDSSDHRSCIWSILRDEDYNERPQAELPKTLIISIAITKRENV